MSLLAKRYATALLLATNGQQATEQIAGELLDLHGALQHGAVRALLLSPDVTASERAATLQKLGDGRHALVQNLLAVLLRRHRLAVLFDLHPAFRALVMLQRGELEGVVETPRPLAEAELARVRELAGRLGGGKVALAVRVRPELLGGIRLVIGNVLYDGSVRTALAQLEQQLRTVPV
ncbi:MAG TPA: ATP synthase F1 subunit delta [Planctomycetota bacterium]|nr:ATP synthase F1 subunit delta [Planctomycetota bacterium]